MNKENNISGLSQIILILAAIFLATNIFLPIWRIEMSAPQYPEGLVLLIYADKLAGNVDIINGLNHYIGMQTLHKENFIEFSIMRYIFGFFVACILGAALIGRKKAVYILFTAFVMFSILVMADFYRWNYNYGHNLDPNAAIKVPGMSYQPPLIGYKQLLNFGAYSIPDIGGILFISSVVLILLVILLERNVFAKWIKRKPVMRALITTMSLFSIISCGTPGPKPVKLNVETCSFCKMTVTDAHFVTQLTTKKGRQYIFDDMICMVGYKKENTKMDYGHFYIADFCHPSDFIDLDHAILLQSDSLHSPMGGNIVGFAVRDSAKYYQSRFSANEVSWVDLIR